MPRKGPLPRDAVIFMRVRVFVKNAPHRRRVGPEVRDAVTGSQERNPAGCWVGSNYPTLAITSRSGAEPALPSQYYAHTSPF